MYCKILVLGLCFVALVSDCLCNKYSKEANVKEEKFLFRMAKINLLWEKASKKLSEPKLKKLMSELKVQDAEEMTLKKLKSVGGDKEGLKEAAVRKKLLGIANRFGLADHYTLDPIKDADHEKIRKSEFKDKKLNKLWQKAEQTGLTHEELKTLREEFQHHQDKVDEYHALIDKSNGLPKDLTEFTNDIRELADLEDKEESLKSYNDNFNTIRAKHQELKNDFKSLNRKAILGPDMAQFTEPKVAALWKLTLDSDFNVFEIQDLYHELKHYEKRLQKLSFFENEINRVTIDKYEDLSSEDREKILSASGMEGHQILNDRLDKQKRKVEKLHDELERKIIIRHTEF